jgi:hypothetical protein
MTVDCAYMWEGCIDSGSSHSSILKAMSIHDKTVLVLFGPSPAAMLSCWLPLFMSMVTLALDILEHSQIVSI